MQMIYMADLYGEEKEKGLGGRTTSYPSHYRNVLEKTRAQPLFVTA